MRAVWLASALVPLVAVSAAAQRALPATVIVAVDEYIDAPRALFGKTRQEVERRLGVTLAGGAHAAPGLALRVASSAALQRVAITAAGYRLPGGLDIGAERGDVERALGEPQLISDGGYLYLYSDGYPDTVEFHFRDDRVHRIEWTYWTP